MCAQFYWPFANLFRAELLGFYAVVRAYRFTGLAAVLGHIGLNILCYSLNPPFF